MFVRTNDDKLNNRYRQEATANSGKGTGDGGLPPSGEPRPKLIGSTASR